MKCKIFDCDGELYPCISGDIVYGYECNICREPHDKKGNLPYKNDSDKETGYNPEVDY